jgi:hypothetical protein
MTSKKKLAKKALKTPELFSAGELTFFQKWLEHKRLHKLEKKKEKDGE